MDVDVSTIPGRYAHALFALAGEKSALDKVEGDLGIVKGLIDGSEALSATVKSPLYRAEQVVSAFADLLKAAKVGDIVTNFVLLVAKNRRLFALVDMIDAYRKIAAKARGEQIAYVTSAASLSDAESSKLIKTLQDKVGGKVILETKEDPELLGGVIVKLGSRMVDASLKRRLERLRTVMKEVD